MNAAEEADGVRRRRIRAERALHDAPPARPGLTWLKEPTGPHEPNEVKDRRDVLAVLSRGRALDDAWFAAGSPLPVPHGCIPIPLTA